MKFADLPIGATFYLDDEPQYVFAKMNNFFCVYFAAECVGEGIDVCIYPEEICHLTPIMW